MRNASEGLENCLCGFDLAPGDEVLTTTQDYPRMLTTLRQRERRDGIVLKTFSIPIPSESPEEIVELYRRNLTARTKLILVSHVINITGQILPVREIVALGRERGIPVVVDGAHAFAHFPFVHSDLDCDYYATSLHKWLFAPHGTGLLYVRRDKISGLWPLMAAPVEMAADIRKFEEIGTHPAANTLAIAEAIAFHLGIGGERKAARLRYLRDRWARPLVGQKRVRLHTSLDPALRLRRRDRPARGHRFGEARRAPVEPPSHLRRRHPAPGVRGHPGHPERLHPPRRDRPLPRRDGARAGERASGLASRDPKCERVARGASRPAPRSASSPRAPANGLPPVASPSHAPDFGGALPRRPTRGSSLQESRELSDSASRPRRTRASSRSLGLPAASFIRRR